MNYQTKSPNLKTFSSREYTFSVVVFGDTTFGSTAKGFFVAKFPTKYFNQAQAQNPFNQNINNYYTL